MIETRDVLDLQAKADGITVSSMDRPEQWQELFGLPIDYHPSFGWNVDTRRSFGVGMAIAVQCASVVARDIAVAGMALWRRKRRRGAAGAAWEEVFPKEHWFARMLSRRPNEFMSWGDFWRLHVIHLKLAQEAFVLKMMNRRGEVVELIPLQPARVRRLVSPAGRTFYEIAANTEMERAILGGDFVVVPADRIIHVVGKSLNGISGLSNLLLGEGVFDLVATIAAYQKDLFAGRGKSPLAFETDQKFDSSDDHEAAFNRLKTQLREAWDRGKPLLLEAGLSAKVLGSNARDNLTEDSFKRAVVQICMFMEVPPHIIYAYDTVKYDNQSHADVQYAAKSLIPVADNIEEQFRNSLFTEDELDELWPEFDRRRMTAADVKSTLERVKLGTGLGVMMRNEAREELGLNPVDGGDVFLQPVNTAQVDEDGNVISQAAEGQPPNEGGNDAGPRLAVDNT